MMIKSAGSMRVFAKGYSFLTTRQLPYRLIQMMDVKSWHHLSHSHFIIPCMRIIHLAAASSNAFCVTEEWAAASASKTCLVFFQQTNNRIVHAEITSSTVSEYPKGSWSRYATRISFSQCHFARVNGSCPAKFLIKWFSCTIAGNQRDFFTLRYTKINSVEKNFLSIGFT